MTLLLDECITTHLTNILLSLRLFPSFPYYKLPCNAPSGMKPLHTLVIIFLAYIPRNWRLCDFCILDKTQKKYFGHSKRELGWGHSFSLLFECLWGQGTLQLGDASKRKKCLPWNGDQSGGLCVPKEKIIWKMAVGKQVDCEDRADSVTMTRLYRNGSQLGTVLPLRGHLVVSVDSADCHDQRGRYCTYWVEARDAARSYYAQDHPWNREGSGSRCQYCWGWEALW